MMPVFVARQTLGLPINQIRLSEEKMAGPAKRPCLDGSQSLALNAFLGRPDCITLADGMAEKRFTVGLPAAMGFLGAGKMNCPRSG